MEPIREMNITVLITTQCDQPRRCSHCWNDYRGTMTIETLRLILERLQASDVNVINMTLSGGEPFAHPKITTILKRLFEDYHDITVLSNGNWLFDNRYRRLTRLMRSQSPKSLTIQVNNDRRYRRTWDFGDSYKKERDNLTIREVSMGGQELYPIGGQSRYSTGMGRPYCATRHRNVWNDDMLTMTIDSQGFAYACAFRRQCVGNILREDVNDVYDKLERRYYRMRDGHTSLDACRTCR